MLVLKPMVTWGILHLKKPPNHDKNLWFLWYSHLKSPPKKRWLGDPWWLQNPPIFHDHFLLSHHFPIIITILSQVINIFNYNYYMYIQWPCKGYLKEHPHKIWPCMAPPFQGSKNPTGQSNKWYTFTVIYRIVWDRKLHLWFPMRPSGKLI